MDGDTDATTERSTCVSVHLASSGEPSAERRRFAGWDSVKHSHYTITHQQGSENIRRHAVSSEPCAVKQSSNCNATPVRRP